MRWTGGNTLGKGEPLLSRVLCTRNQLPPHFFPPVLSQTSHCDEPHSLCALTLNFRQTARADPELRSSRTSYNTVHVVTAKSISLSQQTLRKKIVYIKSRKELEIVKTTTENGAAERHSHLRVREFKLADMHAH